MPQLRSPSRPRRARPLRALQKGATPRVNARDRIGSGPWYNVKHQLIASNLADLHGDQQRDRNNIRQKPRPGQSHMQGRATASQSTLPEPRPLDIRIVMAGLAFILRVLPPVFEGPTPGFSALSCR